MSKLTEAIALRDKLVRKRNQVQRELTRLDGAIDGQQKFITHLRFKKVLE